MGHLTFPQVLEKVVVHLKSKLKQIWSHLLEKSLMENFIFFAANVILFLFSMKHFYLFMAKIAPDVKEYKVVYPDGTSNYITKDDFDAVYVIIL